MVKCQIFGKTTKAFLYIVMKIILKKKLGSLVCSLRTDRQLEKVSKYIKNPPKKVKKLNLEKNEKKKFIRFQKIRLLGQKL